MTQTKLDIQDIKRRLAMELGAAVWETQEKLARLLRYQSLPKDLRQNLSDAIGKTNDVVYALITKPPEYNSASEQKNKAGLDMKAVWDTIEQVKLAVSEFMDEAYYIRDGASLTIERRMLFAEEKLRECREHLLAATTNASKIIHMGGGK